MPLTAQPWQAALGVAPSISALNLGGFLLHSCASITFLVFLNSTQPFLIAQLGDAKHQGAISGNLVFADELLSLFLVLVWGSLADIVGTKAVAVTGYVCIAASLLAYTWADTPWPDLLFCRLTFAVGGSAVTAMLSGILNSYSASKHDREPPTSGQPNERTALLDTADVDEREGNSAARPQQRKPTHGRLAALAGLSTGCGALLAVFFLLRLPTILARLHDRKVAPSLPDNDKVLDEAVRRGTREAFYIVSALAIAVAIALSAALKMDRQSGEADVSDSDDATQSGNMEHNFDAGASPREERRRRMKLRLRRRDGSESRTGRLLQGVTRLCRGTMAGFSLASREADLPLAYLGGALARACTIATTVFVPLLVTRYFYTSGQCDDLPTPDVPADELKRRCRQAFTVASILSGVIQLVALLLAPLIGWVCDVQTPARALLGSTLIGTAAFLTMGTALPHDGDPRTVPAWIAAVGIGLCQIGAIVASLAQCANAKTGLAAASSANKVTAAEAAQTAAATGAGMSSAELIAEDEARRKQQQRRGKAVAAREGASSTRRTQSESTVTGQQEKVFTAVPAPGAIAGAYSATGGLSILVVSSLGGVLSDLYAPAAFLLMAGLAAITAIAAAVVVAREGRPQRRTALRRSSSA